MESNAKDTTMVNRQSFPNRRKALRTSMAMATAGLAGLSPARVTLGAEAQAEKANPVLTQIGASRCLTFTARCQNERVTSEMPRLDLALSAL